MKKNMPISSHEEESLALAAAEEALGEKVSSILLVENQGCVNKTYQVNALSRKFILRMRFNDDVTVEYEREKYASTLAKKAGILTVEILKIGKLYQKHSYQLQVMIDGVRGSECDAQEINLWRQVGEIAKIINLIPVKGYGYNLNKDEKKPWSVDGYLKILASSDSSNILIEKEMLSSETCLRVKKMIELMGAWEFSPMLCHGDLSLGNFLIDKNNKVNIIDWGTVQGHISPFNELAQILCFEETEDINAFCEGYGIDKNFLDKNKSFLNTLQIARLIGTGYWICVEKPEFEYILPDYRKKIGGLLDGFE